MRHEQGFIVPLLAGLLGATATMVLVQLTLSLKPPAQTQGRRTTERVTRLVKATEAIWHRDGRLPDSLQEIEASGLIAAVPRMTADPYSAGTLTLHRVGLEVRVRSAGPDGQGGTPDDALQPTRIRVLAYARDRARLTRLRMLFLKGPHVRTKQANPAALKALQRDVSKAADLRQTAVFSVGRAHRQALRAARALEAKVARQLHALGGPPLPDRVRGAGGLLHSLGLPDALGRSAFGGSFYVSPLGFSSAGPDGKEHTDDDL